MQEYIAMLAHHIFMLQNFSGRSVGINYLSQQRKPTHDSSQGCASVSRRSFPLAPMASSISAPNRRSSQPTEIYMTGTSHTCCRFICRTNDEHADRKEESQVENVETHSRLRREEVDLCRCAGQKMGEQSSTHFHFICHSNPRSWSQYRRRTCTF